MAVPKGEGRTSREGNQDLVRGCEQAVSRMSKLGLLGALMAILKKGIDWCPMLKRNLLGSNEDDGARATEDVVDR
ncbi:unnamed protein product [Protopolystoma xenopodis]|uniref:Uncharacterized protein n=1 Tax=Protopolystoma xenopodis TaxID=117903 RepID=A0A448WYE6_9PLAT|nr:unnamed protein product [Protopolystoma xenopodis]